MIVTQCPTSRTVSDHLYDLLHDMYIILGDDITSSICLGGAFSLNAQGAVDRPVDSIDVCVLNAVWETTLIKFSNSPSWTADILSGAPINQSDVVKYQVTDRQQTSRVCFYKHASFPENIGVINVHGQLMNLYPANDIIRYKMAMLTDRSSTLTEARLRIHMADIVSFLHQSPKQTRQSFLTTVPTLVKRVNIYCESKGFSTRYDVVTNNDSRLEGLTFDIRLSSYSQHVQLSQSSDVQQRTL